MISTQCSSPVFQFVNQEAAAHDEKLVLAAKAGSDDAFAELQIIHSRRLYNRIFSITRNREDAEDTLQDTFLRAYRRLASFEGRSLFSSWLTRIAINSALMTIRRRRARPEISLDDQQIFADGFASFEVRDGAPNQEEICEQRQRLGAILKTIQRLDPKLGIPLAIWMSEEYSMKDLAQHLGISVAAVKARLHRARKHLTHAHAFRNHKLERSQRGRGTSNGRTAQSRQIHREASETSRPSGASYYALSESQSSRCESLYVR